MPKARPEPRWRALLDLALGALDSLNGGYRWSWGGGTALAVHLGHRDSFDIDIFFTDSQALRDLSPQRNPTVRAVTDKWQVPGHYIKLERPEGEIDFIASPLFSDPGTQAWPYEGRDLPLETVTEILAKKLHWRGSAGLARDVFDLAAAHRFAPAEFAAAAALEKDGAIRAADRIRRQIARLKRELPAAVRPTAAGAQILETDLLALASVLDDA
ncbi:MAG: nucleotidyl transferase AbiEii/AbiGii toxin family protein [Rhodospirillales bacterium]